MIVLPRLLGETGEERLLDGLPDVNLRLAASQVLDGRLVPLDYTVDGPGA